jgi:acetolactate synthase-1/2/3 large subunit
MKSSDCFVACLEKEWVQYIFGVPWEENLDLIESLYTSSIKLIVTRNEQTAVFMAATYGRLTWKPWVALATLWPGATNMLTGVAHAQLGAMPLIIITWQKPIKTSKQWLFQIINVSAMMTPITKRSTSIVHGSKIPTIVRQAFKLAEEERPWAVHIELPEDIAAEEINEQILPLEVKHIRRPQIDQKMLQQLVQLIKSATYPLILIWAGANRKRITKYLSKFIDKTKILFFTSQMGKWVVDESSKQYIWTAALSSKDYIHTITGKADLIIAIGYDPIEKPAMFIDYSRQKLIHINFFAATIDEIYQPYLEVVWDIANTCRQLFESELDESMRSFTPITNQIKSFHQLIYHWKDEDLTCMWPHQLVYDLRRVLQKEDILTLDNGLYKLRITRNYRAYGPNTILLDNALATMGAWYSMGMMSKILYPNSKIVTVVGDWWLLMNLGDLETIIRLKLDMVIIILNDDSYGMIKRKQKIMWFQDFGLDFTNPNFVKLAESFGAKGIRIENKDKFAEILQQSMQSTGLTVIDVPFIYPIDII